MMRYILSTLIFILLPGPAHADSPTVIIGLNAEPVFLPGSTGGVDTIWALEAEGLLSTRTLLGETGYLALLADVRGGLIFANPSLGTDEERVSLETGFTFGTGKLVLQGFLNSSVQGTVTTGRFYIPEWEARYYFLSEPGMLNPYISYAGNLKIEPDDATDHFYEGGEIGFDYRPSYLSEYGLSLGAAWEGWYESFRFTPSGSLAPESRNDFLAVLKGKTGGIISLFLDWDVELAFLLRFSNANRYLSVPAVLEEASEDSLMVSLSGDLSWSPSTSITLQAKPFIAYKSYFSRTALSDVGTILDETAYVFTAGGSLRFSWTPDNRVYLVTELRGEKAFTNTHEADLDTSRLRVSAGIKVNLQ